MCFVQFLEGTGADWIFVSVEDGYMKTVVKDNDGIQRFCSFYVDKFTIIMVFEFVCGCLYRLQLFCAHKNLCMKVI